MNGAGPPTVSIDVGHRGLPGVIRFATELAAALRALPEPLNVIEVGTGGGRGVFLGQPGTTQKHSSTTDRSSTGARSGQSAAAWLRRAGLLRPPKGVDVHHATHLGVPVAPLNRGRGRGPGRGGGRVRGAVPVVLTVHDLFPLTERRHARSPAGRAFHRVVLPAAVGRADAVVAVSAFTAAELERVTGRRPDAVIGHGVDHAAWAGADLSAGALPAGVEPPYLLYVGTAKWHKNLATLLAAHAGAPGLPPLVLAGPSAAEVHAALPGAVAGSRLRILGAVPDGGLPALYSWAAAVAVPSLHEGVGLAALEAMSFGAPVAAADSPGLADTVGDAAVLAPAREPAAWADALARLVADTALRSVVVRRGRELAGAHRWAGAAGAYAEVYRAVRG